MFVGVRQHDGALGRPENTGADTQQSTGKDIESPDIVVKRNQQADGVDAITNTADGKRHTDTNPIDNSTGKETDDREGAVERNVL